MKIKNKSSSQTFKEESNFFNKNTNKDTDKHKWIDISTHCPDIKSDNRIKNTKYNVFSFLPYVFFMQIKEPASLLFFLIMMLQTSKTLAIGSFSSSLVPFLFVFFMSMMNEGMDDYRRYKRDKEVNSALYKKIKIDQDKKITQAMPEIEKTVPDSPIIDSSNECQGGIFVSQILADNKKYNRYESVKAMDIKVGDIILVKKGQKFPADCILLSCNDENGELFIRADQLDGETDWKRRQCCIEITDICSEINATVECPDKDIYKFTGRMDQTINGAKIKLPLDLENTAWADTVAATSDALGIVIYTGFQTRAKMNTYMPRNKSGVLDREINSFVLILGFLCMICACCFSALRITTLDGAAFVTIIRFIILFSFMIPISLKVTLDTGRTVYAYTADKKIVIRNTAIQEDLARISFFLTDKTGTLTQNEMLMKKLHLGVNLYDKTEFKELKEILRKYIYKGKRATKNFKEIGSRIFDIVECLSLCHNVTPVETEEGILLQASSPDEIALVEFVRLLGFEILYRDRNTLKICYEYKPSELDENSSMEGVSQIRETKKNNKLVYEKINMEYKIHHIFPFNSDTKRMGIVLERDDGSFVFFEKGADTAMKKICKENDWAEEETDDMAREGLRTLVVGKKELTKESFEFFHADYTEAKLSLTNRQNNMLESQKRLERGLDLLRLTGVEDKLQDNVKETLESLRNAGIKVWMLTGDKIETAISIAKSSRLLDKLDSYLIISGATTELEIMEKIEMLKTGKYNALVIDGISLAVVLNATNVVQNKKRGEKKNYLLEAFIEQTKDLSAVIGCRYTPTQKAMMAAALKTMAGETVMCIGDGGNDVSMITEADAGVGIEGKEGNQAALSADFSLKKFCHVTELMFSHGRNCYVKSAELAKITLRRAFLTTIIQAVFSALVNCVPLSIFQGYMGSFFILFTCFPILTLYHDSDIKKEITLKYPELYKELRLNNLCSLKEFILATLIAYLQATVMTIGYMFILKDREEMHFFSVLVFTSAVINEYVTILLFEKKPKNVTILVIIGSILAFGVCAHFFSEFHIGLWQLLKFTHKIIIINFFVGMIAVVEKLYYNLLNPASHIKVTKYNADKN
ncbi:NEO1 [Ecytonucleospora hepatopenaei]|uniref:Phospholipid-transporting ATPase n=1 Tax=Ecytonucleospora hepatopenaei TaxID=646526 RepID=A0A1W0E2H7_9MICR|nr:NEO1 [Ecytonucleospora hepatopenaei]